MAKVKEKNDLSDSINKVHEPKKNDLNCIIGEIESKLTDIPIPPHAIPIPEFFQHTSHEDGISVGYYCEQNRQSLISFYRQQMANGGWRLRGQTDGAETTLLFRKPDRFCTISLRNHRKNSRLQQLVITIINKMELR